MSQLCKVMKHKEKLICWTAIRQDVGFDAFKIPITAMRVDLL